MNERQLVIPGAELVPDAEQFELMRLAQSAWDLITTEGNANTKAAYKRHQNRYAGWCARFHLKPLPCSAPQLVTFLAWLIEQPYGSPSVVLQAASAIAAIDGWSRTTPEEPSPISVLRSTYYVTWRRRYMQAHGGAKRRKAPTFHRADLERILGAMAEPTAGAIGGHAWAMRAARDRALWLVGIAGALRVSELGALRVEHVERVPEGLLITIPSSKTDQAAEGSVIGIEPSAATHLCPVRAWEAWLHERGEWHGPAWVEVSRSGQLGGARLHQRTLQELLTEHAARVGVRVSSHSLRRVFATTTTHQRKPLARIMAQARWTRTETALSYAEVASVWIDNPTRGLFEGDW
jgi:integrase